MKSDISIKGSYYTITLAQKDLNVAQSLQLIQKIEKIAKEGLEYKPPELKSKGPSAKQLSLQEEGAAAVEESDSADISADAQLKAIARIVVLELPVGKNTEERRMIQEIKETSERVTERLESKKNLTSTDVELFQSQPINKLVLMGEAVVTQPNPVLNQAIIERATLYGYRGSSAQEANSYLLSILMGLKTLIKLGKIFDPSGIVIVYGPNDTVCYDESLLNLQKVMQDEVKFKSDQVPIKNVRDFLTSCIDFTKGAAVGGNVHLVRLILLGILTPEISRERFSQLNLNAWKQVANPEIREILKQVETAQSTRKGPAAAVAAHTPPLETTPLETLVTLTFSSGVNQELVRRARIYGCVFTEETQPKWNILARNYLQNILTGIKTLQESEMIQDHQIITNAVTGKVDVEKTLIQLKAQFSDLNFRENASNPINNKFIENAISYNDIPLVTTIVLGIFPPDAFSEETLLGFISKARFETMISVLKQALSRL